MFDTLLVRFHLLLLIRLIWQNQSKGFGKFTWKWYVDALNLEHVKENAMK